MRHPAALPALAIVAGSAAACFTHVPAAPAAFVSLGAWLAAALGTTRRAFTACVSLAFLCASWSLAAPAFRGVEDPPLRRAFGNLPTLSPVPVHGRLKADASEGVGGVRLDLDVPLRRGPGPLGLRLTVAGSLAAERVGEWRAGRTVSLAASLREPSRSLDPGVPDARLDLARRGTALVGGVKSGALVDVLARGTWFEERAAGVRAFARASLVRHVGRWDPQSAAIVVAILIGDRVGLSDEVQERLRQAGTYHVIAISGGNIAILAGLIFALLRLALVPLRLASPLVIAGLAAYASLVGGGASVLRATVMACAFLAARPFDLRSPPLNALAVSCAAILVATPMALVDPGFALTFGATLGILVGAAAIGPSSGGVASPRRPRLSSWLRVPAALFFASVSAEIALFPVSACAFSRVTFAGLLLNFFAIPLMSVAQVAGMSVLALAAAGVEGPLAAAAGWLAHLGASGLVWTSALVDVVPWLAWRLPPPHPAALAAYYGGWCAWFRLPARKCGAGLVILLSAAWILIEPITLLFPGVSGRLRMTVLDVGHADAILLQLPDRRSILVDTGGSLLGGSFDVGGRVIAPALWALGTRRLDALVVTHGDPDHVGGAVAVVRDFRPREIWEGIPVPGHAPMERLREQAARSGAVWRQRRAGERIVLGPVTLLVHHPPAPEWERRKVRNDDSLVLELRYGDVSVMLPGDVGRAAEQAVLPSVAPAPLRVLKVPHHGSASSSSPAFLAALHPAVAILSASSNTRVPPEVVGRYESLDASIFRTSADGAVTVTTDGRDVRVETFTGRRLEIPARCCRRRASGEWCFNLHRP